MRATAPGQSALLLLDVVALLERRKVDYAVIGALAASVHGVVRASLDADAVVSQSSREAGDLEKAFKSAGFTTALRVGDPDDPIPALLAVSDDFENRVDLLIGLRGLEREAFERVIEVPFQGATLRIIGREDFIAMKVFAGGPQDLSDARRAIESDRPALDTILLRRLAKAYGGAASEALEELLRNCADASAARASVLDLRGHSPDIRESLFEAVLVRAKGQHADPHGKAAAKDRAREEDPPPGIDSFQ